MENQNLNQENQNQTNNQDPKPTKNPKRVAAGKKGAEARWKRMQEAPAEQATAEQQEVPAEQVPTEQKTVTRVTRKPQETEPPFKVNVYKNYIPLCAVLMMVGRGIYMLYNKPVPIQAKQVTQPPQQSKLKGKRNAG